MQEESEKTNATIRFIETCFAEERVVMLDKIEAGKTAVQVELKWWEDLLDARIAVHALSRPISGATLEELQYLRAHIQDRQKK